MMERPRSDRVLRVAESPRGLVRRRLGADGDPWNLALVQRAEVWDQVRMRHLLDSLLAGYPIGAILLCRVEEPSRVIHTQGEKRVVQDADPDGWQLLDGQQRINALVSMFTTSGRYGRFYLHMTRRRTRTGVAARRREKERFLRHIAWTETPDDLVDDRDFCIDLSRWASWAEDELNPGATFDRYTVTAALRNLDSMFTADLDPQGADAAAARLNDLVRAWHHPSVPVLRAEVGSPLDVLEIFSRINLGGVQVAGIDVYFAAVKTFWTEAEQRLAHVTQKAPFLRGRSDALRFVARLASRGIGHGEALPLDVGRLTGPAGELQLSLIHI